METAIAVAILVLVMISGFGVFKGLDLKKWSSWLYVVCAFVSSLLAGLWRADPYGGLMLGALAAALVLYGGTMTRWHRQRYNKEMARAWLSQNQGNTALSPLVRMIRKLLDK